MRQTEHNDTVKIQMTETVCQNLAYHKRTQIFSDKLMCIITFICTHITAIITHSLTEVQCLLIHILSAILQQCKLFAINIPMPKLMLRNCEDHSQLFTNKWEPETTIGGNTYSQTNMKMTVWKIILLWL